MEILNYINGEWIKPNIKEDSDVINPATGQLVARTLLCNAEDVDLAAHAAAAVFPAWSRRF